MAHIERRLTFHSSPHDVFASLVDIEARPEWRPDIKEAYLALHAPLDVGTTFARRSEIGFRRKSSPRHITKIFRDYTETSKENNMGNKPSYRLGSNIAGTILDIDIVRLDSSHAKQAVETLVRAFLNQQPFQYYFPDKTERERVTPYLMSMAVLPGFQYGEVHATSYNMEGIAIWLPSDNYPISPWRILRSVPLSVTLGFARYGNYRLKDFGQYIDAVHARLAPFKHIYLQSLGVNPDFQGKGHAGRLLKHMTTRMDTVGLPSYLETLEALNVRFYEHFGFTVVNQSTIPGTNLTNWAMLREAR